MLGRLLKGTKGYLHQGKNLLQKGVDWYAYPDPVNHEDFDISDHEWVEKEAVQTDVATENNARHTFYDDKRLILEKLETVYLRNLEEMIEPAIYRQHITEAAKETVKDKAKEDQDKEDKVNERFILGQKNEQEGPALYCYKAIANALKDAQVFLEAVSRIHEHVVSIQASNKIGQSLALTQMMNPWSSLNKDLRGGFDAYIKLYKSLELSGINRAFDEMSGQVVRLTVADSVLKEVARMAHESFQPVQTFVTSLPNNPFYSASKNQSAAFKRLMGFSSAIPAAPDATQDELPEGQQADDSNRADTNPQAEQRAEGQTFDFSANLLGLQEALNKITTELIGRDIPRDSLEKVRETIDTVSKLRDEIMKFRHSAQKLVDLFALLRTAYPLANKMITQYPQAYVSVNKALKGHFVTTAYQLNKVFQNVFLTVDKLEVEGYLKEHYLLSSGEMDNPNAQSFSNFVKVFNTWIEGLGCEFGHAERFPYTYAVARQRSERYNEERQKPYAVVGEIGTKLEFMSERAEKAQADFAAEAAALLVKKQQADLTTFDAKKKAIFTLIDGRVKVLEAEINQSWITFGSTKYKKIHSLVQLKATVTASRDGQDLARLFKEETIKTEVSARAGARADLLFEGRTGKMLHDLRFIAASRQTEVDVLSQLQEQLASKRFWFFATRRTRTIQSRVEALEHLKKWLATDGYNLEDALQAVKVDNAKHYDLLHYYETSILEDIRKMETYLNKDQMGKRLIKADRPQDPILVKARLDAFEEFCDELQHQKLLLQTDTSYFSFFVGSRIKALDYRIQSMNELKSWLAKPGYHLDNSLIAFEFDNPVAYALVKNETALFEQIRLLERRSAAAAVASEGVSYRSAPGGLSP